MDGSIEILSPTFFRCGDTQQTISSSTSCCSEAQDLPNQSLRPSLPQAWQFHSGSSDDPVRYHRRRRGNLVHLHLMWEPLNRTLVRFEALAARISYTYPGLPRIDSASQARPACLSRHHRVPSIVDVSRIPTAHDERRQRTPYFNSVSHTSTAPWKSAASSRLDRPDQRYRPSESAPRLSYDQATSRRERLGQ